MAGNDFLLQSLDSHLDSPLRGLSRYESAPAEAIRDDENLEPQPGQGACSRSCLREYLQNVSDLCQ